MYMAFFSSAITTLKTLVVAIGAGFGVWGDLNLLEGYEILELARTGITGLNRGIKNVTLIDQEGNIKKI